MRTAMNSPQARKNRGRREPLPAPQRANTLRGPRYLADFKALGPEAEGFLRKLAIVNEFMMWEECPRETCRRARKCRGDNAECFNERRYELKRRILQLVVWMMCTAEVSSDEFYDYLDEVTDEEGEDEGM